MGVDVVKNKKGLVLKRDGREEPFNKKKLMKVLAWACDGNEGLAKTLYSNLSIKIYNKIKVQDLMKLVRDTASNLVSELAPIWDDVAKRLYIQEIYKDTWNIKRSTYPDFLAVVAKGLQYKVYDKDVISSFSEEELVELGGYIDQKSDLDFTYLGLKSFYAKYCKKYSKNKKLELPQHVAMRVAMFAFYKEPKDVRLSLIKERYDYLKDFYVTEATPKTVNSLTLNPQMSSCVLMEANDSSKSINYMNTCLGLYSKFGGGVAFNLHSVRSINSPIGISGVSGGKVPFIKLSEAVVSAYDQGGVRRGAGILTFNWWDYEVFSLLDLKAEGGSEDLRARNLQYSIVINNILLKKALLDEDVHLFDPKDVPKLLETYGEYFEKHYEEYSAKKGIRSKRVKAKELIETILKMRFETGNLYIFFDENVNKQGLFKDYIKMSNLCSEILLPTKPLHPTKDVIKQSLGGVWVKEGQTEDLGEIALCNLSSINAVKFMELSEEQKERLIYNLLRASDNLIDYAFYPVPEGELSNKNRRNIGVGVSNYAHYLAKNKVKATSEEAEVLTYQLMESIYYYLLKASVRLAKERGTPTWWKKSKYSDGVLPLDLHKLSSEYTQYSKYDFEPLREGLKTVGGRFSALMAIAPTASSSLSYGGTQGTDFPKKLVTIKTDNDVTEKQLVPDLNKYREYYTLLWDIPNEILLKLGAIRQIFVDQSQSLPTQRSGKDKLSMAKQFEELLLAQRLGVKTLYYSYTQDIDEVACESCSS